MKNEIYYIKWIDAQGDDGWIPFREKGEISSMIIETVGFLIDKNKDYIKLGLSVGQNTNGCNKQFNGTMAIPKKCIIKKRKL